MTELDFNRVKQQILAGKTDYQILVPNNGQEVQFRFIGSFMDKEVIWQAQLLTRDEYHRLHNQPLSQQKMTISALANQHYQIQIVLKLAQLNTASILMAIKMVRQYKRLKVGEHFWN